MSHHSIIYGRISGATGKPEDYYKFHRLNLEVLDQLPRKDEEYPWINRSMFSVANEQGVFRDQVITFGASYKSLEYDWEAWLLKFESILAKLFWFDVMIHAEFEVRGDFTYAWFTKYEHMEKYWDRENPIPIPEWNFDGSGPRSFTDLV